MKILFNISNLSLSYGSKNLFNETGFRVLENDKIGLLGLNGSGKSTLLKILAQKTTYHPDWTVDLPKDGLNVQLIPQQLPLPDKQMSIKQYFYFFNDDLKESFDSLNKINEQLETNSNNNLLEKQKDVLEFLESKQAWFRVSQFESYLKYFSVHDLDKNILNLSGGERKKVLLSIGLSSVADLLLWDEPTNHLDINTIDLFENELNNSSKSFVLISHDRHLLSKTTSKIYSIRGQKIHTFDGDYTDYLEHLSLKEEERKKLVHKLKNKLKREQDWMNQGIKARGTRSKKRVESFHGLKSSIEVLKQNEKKKLSLSIDHSSRKSKKIMELVDISVSRGDLQILKNANATIWKNDKIGLIGDNGSGKSSLLKVLIDQLKIQKGHLKKADDLIIEYFDQNREELKPDETPFDFLGEGQDSVQLPDGRTQHIAGYFERFLFNKDDLYRPIRTLSGGEKNRLQLAKYLAKKADIWLFDEPTNDLDLETLEILEKTLMDFKGSFIVISHDRSFLENITTSIWSIEDKKLEVYANGFSDIQAYLTLKAMEAKLSESNKTEQTQPISEIKTEQKKLSNKQKFRLKELPKLIAEREKILEKYQKEVENFDFADNSTKIHEDYQKLCKKSETIENELLTFYEELEDLE